jgi:SAM-dependent methyltransferase
MAYRFEYKDCNICGADKRGYVGKRIPRAYLLDEGLIADIVVCKRCGLFYPYPMPTSQDEEIKSNYGDPEQYFPHEISEGRLKLYNLFLRKIFRITGKKGRLLDVGCGRGEMLYVAKKNGWDVLGIDISSDFVKYAKDKFDVDARVGDINGLNFASESFDVVTLLSVLDHMYDPRGSLLALNRILKRGGLLCIEVMNNESLVYKLGDFYYRLKGKKITTRLSPTFPSFQIYGFSTKSLPYLLRISGFKVVKMAIRGGVSNVVKVRIKGGPEKILRTFRTLCFALANFLNNGQVLEVYARKG